MRWLPGFDVGLRIGCFAMLLGAWLAACGSISVINDPDGGSGSGGAVGSGGAGGSGKNGKGGAVGSSGGSGVSSDGGAGHTGSAGGHTGAGGATGGGTGGANGGGTGGANGGGTGGAGGIGGTGGSGVSCPQLQRDFTTALADAKSCITIGSTTECAKTTLNALECGCTTYVTAVAKINTIRQAWTQNSCASGVCPGIVCGPVSGAVCTLSAQTGQSVCMDQSGIGPI
jgi:hypothetical protein